MKTPKSIPDLVVIAKQTRGDDAVQEALEKLIGESVSDSRLWPLLLESSIIQTDTATLELLSKCNLSKSYKPASFPSLPRECKTFVEVAAYQAGFVWNEQLSTEEINGLLSDQAVKPEELAEKSRVFASEREAAARTKITIEHMRSMVTHPLAVLDLSPKLEGRMAAIRKNHRPKECVEELSRKECSQRDFRFITSIEDTLYEALCKFISPRFRWDARQSALNSMETDYLYRGASGGHWELSLIPLEMKDVEVGKIKPKSAAIRYNMILPCPT